MKRILVALDGSSRAPLVLGAAVRLATRCEAKLVLFRAIGLGADIPREIFGMGEARVLEILRDRARAELDVLARDVGPALIERIATEIGTPWDSIVRAGRDLDADQIVVGSHGFSGIDHVLGTTAAKVVNHADRNVLVVRTPL